MSSTHSRLKNLIRAKDVEEILAVEGMQHMMPNLTIHTIYSNVSIAIIMTNCLKPF